MKPLTHEWIEKAEGDFASAGREVRAGRIQIMMRLVFMLNNASKSTSKPAFRKQIYPSQRHMIYLCC
jgi:hypothetical protein